jgi:hypothetical protein
MRLFHALSAVIISVVVLSNVCSADVIPSPNNDLALVSYGGVGYASSSYHQDPADPTLLNDGNRDGIYEDGSVILSATPNSGEYQGIHWSSAVTIGTILLWDRTHAFDPSVGARINPFEVTASLHGHQVWNSGSVIFNNDITIIGVSHVTWNDFAKGMILSLNTPVRIDDIRVTTVAPERPLHYLGLAEIEAYSPLNVVPEPSTFALLELGRAGLAIGAIRRRRRNAAA